MNTEQEAWRELVRTANRIGRHGFYLQNYGICYPSTATGQFAIYYSLTKSVNATECFE